MTKSGKPAREFWIVSYDYERGYETYSDKDRGIKRYEDWSDYADHIKLFHVIEHSAYDQLLTEVDRLKASLREAIEALEKTPCTGNGDVHLLSCFKCSQIAKLRERHGELKGMG